MATTAPVAIGTRGTVGSLIKKEIEYFSKLELERRASFRQTQGHFAEISCSRSIPRSSFWLTITSWKRKKRRGGSSSNGSGRFLPSMCSAVEVEDSNGLNGAPGFGYRVLKSDM